MDGDDEEDPVKAAFGDRMDLYDVADWDVRSRLDALAVGVYTGLRTSSRLFLVVFALSLFAAEITVVGVLVVQEPTIGVLGALSVVPAVFLALYFWWDDPTRREPLPTLVMTFVLAVVFATLAAVVNTVMFGAVQEVSGVPGVTLLAPAVLFFLVVGPVEETVKWLAVRLHAYRSADFDTVVDGVVYGAVAGLGFASIENLAYISQGYVVPEGVGVTTQLGGAFSTATSRAFVGPGHVIYSALAGYYLGLAKFNPGRRGPIVVKGLLVAAFVHGLYNTFVNYLPLSGPTFVVFVVLYDGFWIAVLYRKVSRYRRLYRRARTEGPSR